MSDTPLTSKKIGFFNVVFYFSTSTKEFVLAVCVAQTAYTTKERLETRYQDFDTAFAEYESAVRQCREVTNGLAEFVEEKMEWLKRMQAPEAD
jgi:hypothetical protein